MSDVKVFKSKRFVTETFTAIFPKLNAPDEKYGGYSVLRDVLGDPQFEETLKAQAAETLVAGQKKLGTDKVPTNSMFRDGVYKDNDGGETPTRRVTFKMADSRKVKGSTVAQKPRLVDAKRQPVTDQIWGGSEIKVAYFFQYTILQTGACYLSVKLDAVQVIKLVTSGGVVAIDDMFGEEDGFETKAEEVVVPNNSPAVETEGPANGSDF